MIVMKERKLTSTARKWCLFDGSRGSVVVARSPALNSIAPSPSRSLAAQRPPPPPAAARRRPRGTPRLSFTAHPTSTSQAGRRLPNALVCVFASGAAPGCSFGGIGPFLLARRHHDATTETTKDVGYDDGFLFGRQAKLTASEEAPKSSRALTTRRRQAHIPRRK